MTDPSTDPAPFDHAPTSGVQVSDSVSPEDDRPAEGDRTDERDRTAELEAAVERLEDEARRALADLDNSHKRHARDLQQVRAAERADVARQFLPLVDHLELALDHASSEPTSIIEGVRQVLGDATETFGRLGFDRFDQVGVPFDPARHEAVSAVELEGVEPGTVVHVVRPGYGEGTEQLRPASVVVATGPQ